MTLAVCPTCRPRAHTRAPKQRLCRRPRWGRALSLSQNCCHDSNRQGRDEPTHLNAPNVLAENTVLDAAAADRRGRSHGSNTRRPGRQKRTVPRRGLFPVSLVVLFCPNRVRVVPRRWCCASVPPCPTGPPRHLASDSHPAPRASARHDAAHHALPPQHTHRLKMMLLPPTALNAVSALPSIAAMGSIATMVAAQGGGHGRAPHRNKQRQKEQPRRRCWRVASAPRVWRRRQPPGRRADAAGGGGKPRRPNKGGHADRPRIAAPRQ